MVSGILRVYQTIRKCPGDGSFEFSDTTGSRDSQLHIWHEACVHSNDLSR